MKQPTEKQLVKLIIKDKLEDSLKSIPQEYRTKALAFEYDFWAGLYDTIAVLKATYNSPLLNKASRKGFALSLKYHVPCRDWHQYFYALYDKQPIRELLCKNILNRLSGDLDKTRWLYGGYQYSTSDS